MRRIRLMQLREARGLTQAEVARAVGLRSDSAISMLESGIKNPSWVTAQRLSQFFDTPVDDLFALSKVTGSDITDADTPSDRTA